MLGIRRGTLLGMGLAALLVTVAVHYPDLTGTDVRARWAPTLSAWLPRVSPLTPAIIASTLALVALAPLAQRLSWRALLVTATATAWAWTLLLALLDGRDGVAATFARDSEYLAEALEVGSVSAMLAGFVDRIPLDAPDNWAIHVAGHPPGALLFFVGLVRAGVTDPFDVGLVVLTIGATTVTAVLVAVRALAGEDRARLLAPFLVIGPSALWVGVSADGMFAAVTAWGLAALALAATRERGGIPLAVLGGVLLGVGVSLSYGLVLMGIPALAVLAAARSWRPLPWAVGGGVVVLLAFAVAGFAWWEAYPVLRERYYDGAASERPYSYWVWANVAAWLISAGVGVGAGVAAAVSGLRARLRDRDDRALVLLGASGLGCVLAATLSGMSKAEVERIWLPFTPWVLCLLALLPVRDRRLVLLVQAAAAVVTLHLLDSYW